MIKNLLKKIMTPHFIINGSVYGDRQNREGRTGKKYPRHMTRDEAEYEKMVSNSD